MEMNQNYGTGDSNPRPELIKYVDYRKFMEDSYNFKKSTRSGFSYRLFSKLSGVSSPNYLQLVMQGKRNMSEDIGRRVAKVLKLSANETQFFISLIRRENAKEDTERIDAEKAILRAAKNILSKEVPKAEEEIVSHWYHMVVRELILLPDFEPTGEWISIKLKRLITSNQAEASLNYLLKSGFLTQKDGRFFQSEPVLDSGDGFNTVRMFNVHAENLEAWIKLLRNLDLERENTELGLLHIPISKDKIPLLKKKIRDFQDEIIGWLNNEKEPTQVVQLGTYLIPVTKNTVEN